MIIKAGTEVFTCNDTFDAPKGILGWLSKDVDTDTDRIAYVHYKNFADLDDYNCFYLNEIQILNEENWCKQILKWMNRR